MSLPSIPSIPSSPSSPTVSGIVGQQGPPGPGAPNFPGIYATGSCGSGCTENSSYTPCKPGDIAGPLLPGCDSCRQQNSCFMLNPNICPRFSTGTGSAAWTDPISNVADKGNYTKSVTCTYNTSTFNNVGNVTLWVEMFGTNDSYVNTIMPNFCVQQSKNCLPYPPIPGAPTSSADELSSCSNFIDTGPSGALCRIWASSNPDLAQTAYNNYCSNNNTPDCSCINRAHNSEYESIKASPLGQTLSSFNDGCWYLPCSIPLLFLTSSESANPGSSCEQTACGDIQDFINDGGTINGVSSNELLNCSLTGSIAGSSSSGTTGGSGPTGGNGTTGGTGGGNGGNGATGAAGSSSLSKYKWVIIGVIAVVLLIIIILIFFFSRHKKSVPKDAIK